MSKKNILIISIVLSVLIVALLLFFVLKESAGDKPNPSETSKLTSSIYDEDLPSSVQSQTSDEEWTSIYEATPVD